MTLKEAHEIQRKELISLRAENKRLKSGTFTNEEKQSLEKEIRSLKATIKELNTTIERYQYLLDIEKRKNAHLSDIVYGDFELLKNDYAFLKQCNEQLTIENQSLKDSNDKLKAQMNRDHENSSIPSSKERFPKKIKNSRVKSGKKPGAQHGHIGHKRPHMSPTKPAITIPVPSHIISNPDYYLTGKMITKQVCDIEVSVSVTEYTTPEYRSRSTGKRGHAPFPTGVINEFNYGPNAKALELLYSFREHKGHEGIKGTPVEEYQQILVHDHDKTYYNYGGNHQECLAHVLRYLQDSIDNEPHLTWNSKMKEFLSSLIHSYKSEPHLYDERLINEKEKEYSKILSIAASEYLNHPPKKYYPDGFNLYKRMEKYKAKHLLFLRHPEINYTNNLSERSLRKFKRKQIQAVTFRSNKSVEYLCDCMSIIQTYRLYNTNIFDIVRSAFS